MAGFTTSAMAETVTRKTLTVPQNAQTGQGEVSSRDEKLSEAYAKHLYVSMCNNNYRGRFKTAHLTPAEKNQLNTHTSGACTCMYERIEDKATSTELIDYVMYSDGAKPPSRGPDPKIAGFMQTPSISKIRAITADKSVRKKCGFIN